MADTEIVKSDRGEMTQPVESALPMIAMLERAARDPLVDVGKLERLLALADKMKLDERRTAFRAAKSRLAAKLPQVGQSGKIVHGTQLISRYAKLEDIDVAIRPLLAEEGFAFSFDSDTKGTDIVYTAELAHRDGYAETRTISVKADTSGAKNSIQAVGSATSYARRMLIKMHLNLVECAEDDDGNGKDARPITEEHAGELAKMLADARAAGLGGFEDARFLKWKKVQKFTELLDRDFETLRDYIKDKRAKEETPK